MAGRTDGLIKNFRAGAALPPFTIVKLGATDTDVLAAAGAGDGIIGVTGEVAAAQGERVDVHMGEIADVRFGGPVVRGVTPITSDAAGAGVAAAPAAGALARILGIPLVSAAAGDVGPVLIQPAFYRG